MEELFKVLSAFGNVTDYIKDVFEKNTYFKEYTKHSMVLDEGDNPNKVFFILKGGLRTYYVIDEVEHTFSLRFENDFVSSTYCYFNNVPNFKCIEAIEDCELLVFDLNKIEPFVASNLELCNIFRKMAFYSSSFMEEKILFLRIKDPRDRYFELMDKHPRVFLRAKLQYIASLLGITHETLSRIRAGK